MRRGTLVLAVALVPGETGAQAPGWPQWGGPTRDFKVAAAGLAASWPAAGPRRLWSRALGDGYSTIVADGGALYTMYRPVKGQAVDTAARFRGAGGEPEVVVALDAATGRTLWEHSYAAPFVSGLNLEHGPGPHSTPLVAGDLLYAVGATGKLHALNKRTGKVVWSHDLWGEMGGKVMNRGYSCSPLAYKGTIILTLGGPGQAVAAFDQRTGKLVWKNQDFDLAPSSPQLVNVDGQDQLVIFHADGIAGIDPQGGALLWEHPHETSYGLNISTPVWGRDNVLFCSSAYSGGSRALRLTQSGGKTTVKELWFTNRLRIHFGNAIRIGDFVYGSSGDFGPAFLAAVNVRTGEIAWQERGFAHASAIHAGGKLVILDEDGILALATVSPQGLEVHAKAQVLANRAWTAPTLVGTMLYARDRVSILALDLG